MKSQHILHDLHELGALMRPKFNTPFFIIRHDADAADLRQFVERNNYDAVQWAQDKEGNPLCRIGKHIDGRRFPDRVATVCVRRHNLLEQIKAAISQHLRHSHEATA